MRGLDQAAGHDGGHERGIAQQLRQPTHAVGEFRAVAMFVNGVGRKQIAGREGRRGDRDEHPDQHDIR